MKALLATSALFLCDSTALFLAIRFNGTLALALHACACLAALALAWRRRMGLTAPLATLRMTTLLLPFLGPIAALAGAATLVVHLVRGVVVADASVWHEHLFPNLAADTLTERTNAISRRHPAAEAAGEIESFYDVLRWGSLPEQEHVLSLISRSFRPEFAPVLRAGLAVADLGLRAQAAAGLSVLETRTSSHLVELQADYHRHGTESAAIRLAQALSEAAHSGLYDQARAEEMRREMVHILQPVAADGATVACMMLGRTLIQLGDIARAVDILQRADDTAQQSDAAFSWLLEGLFRQGDYARLTDLLARQTPRVQTIEGRDGPLAPALQFWSAPA